MRPKVVHRFTGGIRAPLGKVKGNINQIIEQSLDAKPRDSASDVRIRNLKDGPSKVRMDG